MDYFCYCRWICRQLGRLFRELYDSISWVRIVVFDETARSYGCDKNNPTVFWRVWTGYGKGRVNHNHEMSSSCGHVDPIRVKSYERRSQVCLSNNNVLTRSMRVPLHRLLEGWLRHKSDMVNFEA